MLVRLPFDIIFLFMHVCQVGEPRFKRRRKQPSGVKLLPHLGGTTSPTQEPGNVLQRNVCVDAKTTSVFSSPVVPLLCTVQPKTTMSGNLKKKKRRPLVSFIFISFLHLCSWLTHTDTHTLSCEPCSLLVVFFFDMQVLGMRTERGKGSSSKGKRVGVCQSVRVC